MVEMKTMSYFKVLFAVLSFLPLALIKAEAEIAEVAEIKIETAEVVYHSTPSAKVQGYLAFPALQNSYPAVVLIHEWWGLNDDIRAKARQFASEGYVALAVDLYDGEYGSTPAQARQLAGRVRGNMEGAFANLRAAFSYLREHPRVQADKLASVGWCFGGGWSYQIAKNNLGAKASVIYYGRFNPADDLDKMRASILGHFGEEDRSIKVSDVKQFQVKLKTLVGDHQVFIYPNAGHGFANPDNPSYNREAASLAYKRTLDFLNQNL